MRTIASNCIVVVVASALTTTNTVDAFSSRTYQQQQQQRHSTFGSRLKAGTSSSSSTASISSSLRAVGIGNDQRNDSPSSSTTAFAVSASSSTSATTTTASDRRTLFSQPAQQQQRRKFQLPTSGTTAQSTTSKDTTSTNDLWSEWIVPVTSAACLTTGNTVGAGCLVLPDLASTTGLGIATGIFGAAYVVNLLSGLVIAEIAIQQNDLTKQEQLLNPNKSATTTTPASFKEMAQASLKNPIAANGILAVSLFVNSCVLSFDVTRAGTVSADLLLNNVASAVGGIFIGNTDLMTDLVNPASVATMISLVWSIGLVLLSTTNNSSDLSKVATACATAMFASFGGLLLPGLLNVHDPIGTWLQQGTAATAAAAMDITTTTAATGTLSDAISHAAPVILMSMIYQNIVPNVTKLLNYDRIKTVMSLVIGSGIPLVMYLSWCYVCLGGGIDISTGGVAGSDDSMLLTIFSLATVAGSSLGCIMSLTEEFDSLLRTIIKGGFTTKQPEELRNQSGALKSTTTASSPVAAAVLAAAVPLGLAMAVANGPDFTFALSLAGSFGSPILYGVLPAWMAWNVRQQQNHQRVVTKRRASKQEDDKVDTAAVTQPLVPALALPMLGGLSMFFIGGEMIQRYIS